MNKKYCVFIFFVTFLFPKTIPAQAYWHYQQGEEYFYGQNGKQQSYEKALFLYRKAAEKGSPDAECRISICYQYGYGVDQSDREAFIWAKKAAKHGNAQAQNAVGVFYYLGTGCMQNYRKGIKWLTRSANRGYAEAIHNLQEMGGYPKITYRFPDE